MQKHFRASVAPRRRGTAGQSVFLEALNPHSGFFYTVKSIRAQTRTRFQDLALLDTHEFGKVLLLDQVTQVADKNDFFYHEPMVHPALSTHPDPQTVLVIGGGDGGILREVLKYRTVRRVDLAELDDQVISFSKRHLTKVHGGAFGDPRLSIHLTDGRRFIEERPGSYDAVIMDMTDPSGPSTFLYTREFFSAVKASLRNKNGVFVMHSESPIARPRAFASIQATLGSVFPEVHPFYLFVPMYGTLWSVTVSAQSRRIAIAKGATIDGALRRSGIRGLKVYSGATHHAMRTPLPCIAEILSRPARIITDAKPYFSDGTSGTLHHKKKARH